jgi:hypothetical protein
VPVLARADLLRVLTASLAALVMTSCATRELRKTIYDRNRVEVILVEHKRGFETIERTFSHPTRISQERLSNILGALEIRGSDKELAGIRYVFQPEHLDAVSAALAFGLGRANASQTIAIRMTAKVMQHGVFDRKHMTSFVSYVQDDLLFLHVSRVDWRVPDRTKKTEPPLPRVDEHPMKFKVIPLEGMYAEGNWAVSVDWKSRQFAKARNRAAGGDKGERTILLEDETAREELERPIPSDLLSQLTPQQLRALADLEEARQQGTVTEGHYRRKREKILDEARRKRN